MISARLRSNSCAKVSDTPEINSRSEISAQARAMREPEARSVSASASNAGVSHASGTRGRGMNRLRASLKADTTMIKLQRVAVRESIVKGQDLNRSRCKKL